MELLCCRFNQLCCRVYQLVLLCCMKFDQLVILCCRRFGQMVMVNYSSVKIPDGVERDAELTVDTVEWSSQLEDTFRLASQADPEIM